MKHLSLNFKTVLTTLLALITFNAFSQNYTTMADGNWGDPTIWSTDGGVTSCTCIPAEPTAGANITIKHIVDLGANNVTITGGSKLTVVAFEGQITSLGLGGKITINDGELYVNNDVSINTLEIGANGTVNVVGYSTFLINSSIEVYGTLNIFGGYFLLSTGNLDFMNGSAVTLSNFSKIDVTIGNLTNNGELHIGATSCIETSGTWQNEVNGNVTGGGSALTDTGSLKNFGTWAATVNWCGGGNPQNMPPENCAEATNECGMLVLGVSFGKFEAYGIGNEVLLYWNTISEKNNDYFLVQRSLNGFNFETIGMVDGNGTTEEEMEYAFTDPAPHNGMSYYRLEQINLDGNSESTPLKAVEISEGNDLVVVASYNLMGQEVSSDHTGVVIDLLNDGTTRKRFVH